MKFWRITEVKMANRKCILYVGGLDPEVTEELLHSSFIVFGDIKSVQIPKDFKISKKSKLKQKRINSNFNY